MTEGYSISIVAEGETFVGDQLCKLTMAELELTPSICSSSYSLIVPEADPPGLTQGTESQPEFDIDTMRVFDSSV